MITKISLRSSLLLMFFLSGCNSSLSNTKENINTESVIKESDRIVATNTFGTLTITAGKNNIRYLSISDKDREVAWTSNTVRVKLLQDTLDGLSCNTNVKKIRYPDGGGYSHVEMQESQLYFNNVDEAKEMLNPKAYDEWHNPRLWSSNGLYVYWNPVNPEYWIFPKQSYINIKLFQINIDGKKPYDLPGAKDDKIKVEHLTDEELKAFEKSVKPFLYIF
jgi:hypothetical protein